ncbi:MAG: glutamate dehydrogenase, partial [Bacillus sp. (in: firmicutes)]
QGYYWTEREVDEKLKEKMETSFEQILHESKKYRTNLKVAAYIVGIQALAETSQLRGWIKI